jgi:hypothetical protein
MTRFVAKLTDTPVPIKLNLAFVAEIHGVLDAQQNVIAWECFGPLGNPLGRIDVTDFNRVQNFQATIPVSVITMPGTVEP